MAGGDIVKILELHKKLIEDQKLKLNISEDSQYENCDNEHQRSINQQSVEEDKENRPKLNNFVAETPPNRKNLPLIEQLDLDSNNDGNLKGNNQAFSSEKSPCSFRSDDNSSARKMLRYGEFSPNNPELKVTLTAPYLGLGEYEQRRNYFSRKQRAEYLDHLTKSNQKLIEIKNSVNAATKLEKAVQTDLQNISLPLVQYDLQDAEVEASLKLENYSMQHNNRHNLPLSSSTSSYRGSDQRLTSAQNAFLKSEAAMDKPKSILSNRRTGSPRDRLMSDLKHSYTPSFMDGFSFQDRSDELERERLKRDKYQHDLRVQIEEKRRYQSLREEQDRREQELENRRLEQQLMRMQEEQAIEDQRRSRRDEQLRRHSEDLMRRKQEMQSRYRKHTDSESGASCLRNTNVASKALSSHYSPPPARRAPYSFNIPSTSVFANAATAEGANRYGGGGGGSSSSLHPNNRFDSYYRKDVLNRMDSLNSYDKMNYDNNSYKNNCRSNAFNRYDSLSRIDSLNRQDTTLDRIETLNIRDSLSNIQRRHSATQQDLSVYRQRSPKLQRRSSSSRFDDTLPIPVLKAHSPVAKELKHSVPFSSNSSACSRHSSDAIRKLEDRWQIPAVQKNLINHSGGVDGLLGGHDGQNRSILTQLGAIRMQLQQEQMRMDETLRKRGITQSKAVDFH